MTDVSKKEIAIELAVIRRRNPKCDHWRVTILAGKRVSCQDCGMTITLATWRHLTGGGR